MIEVRKKEGESTSALHFRFSKKIKRSGIMKELKKRRFHDRPVSRRSRRISAGHRDTRRKEVERLKKLGLM